MTQSYSWNMNGVESNRGVSTNVAPISRSMVHVPIPHHRLWYLVSLTICNYIMQKRLIVEFKF